MNKKPFSFQKQLKKGQLGEAFFAECYGHNSVQINSREFDFYHEGERLELKTDFSNFSNFFIERYGNIEKKKDGSVFKCITQDIKWFVYLYWNTKTFYWFSPADLVNYIEKNKNKYEEKIIRNIGWAASGWAIPIADVENLVIRKDKFE